MNFKHERFLVKLRSVGVLKRLDYASLLFSPCVGLVRNDFICNNTLTLARAFFARVLQVSQSHDIVSLFAKNRFVSFFPSDNMTEYCLCFYVLQKNSDKRKSSCFSLLVVLSFRILQKRGQPQFDFRNFSAHTSKLIL